MEIEITIYQDLTSYCHLYYQQYSIDKSIDFDELQNRLGWIDFQNNLTKFADELANDTYASSIIQPVIDLLLEKSTNDTTTTDDSNPI
jgi:uncharacterized FAD-dependent dehydrogenase